MQSNGTDVHRIIVKVMERMGFTLKSTSLVYECISSVSFAFNPNGEARGKVIPSRGIRQGCSLSPYLFL